MIVNPFCTSSYLAFRHVVGEHRWINGIEPVHYNALEGKKILVDSADDIYAALEELMRPLGNEKLGLFLSGGIDSGILAAFMPKDSCVFTIDFKAESSIIESEGAKAYAVKNQLRHYVIEVTQKDYEQYELPLSLNKKAPLHPVEIALFKATELAREQNISTIVVGNGADSNFGGLDKLLAKDWEFEEFIDRYNFIDPATVLKRPASVREVYKPYRQGDKIDYLRFLNEIHGEGTTQAFCNAIYFGGLSVIAPYEKLQLKSALDIDRIRYGEPKYLLVELFDKLYSEMVAPKKVAFARPMHQWMADFKPKSDIFIKDLDMSLFTGEQKYIMRSLDKFVGWLELLCR